jgi:hypothetical protein
MSLEEEAMRLLVAMILMVPTAGWGDSRWELRLALSTDSSLPGEPVLAVATMEYKGEDPFRGYATLGRSALGYTGPRGERWGLAFSPAAFAGPQDELPPAEAIAYPRGYVRTSEAVAISSASGAGDIRPEPGVGRFTFWVQIWEGHGLDSYRPLTLQAAPASMKVVPVPNKEREAFAIWSGRDKLRMLLSGEREGRTEADLRALVERYPDSAYAKYALMALAQGKRWQRVFLGIVVTIMTDAVRDEQKRLAAEEVALLEQVVQRYGTFHLSPVVLDRIIEVASSPLGDWGRAEKYAKMLLALENAPQSFRRRAEQALDAASRVRAAGKAD